MNAFNFILLRNTCAISKSTENITLQMYIDINSREVSNVTTGKTRLLILDVVPGI